MNDKFGFVCVDACGVVERVEKIAACSEVFEEDAVKRFLRENLPSVLLSMGDCVGTNGRVNAIKVPDNFRRKLATVEESALMASSDVLVDSGGFQLQTGSISKTEIARLRDAYNECLACNYESLSGAFSLDIAPGKVCPFNTWKEGFELNFHSYTTHAELPSHVREKMFAIHHFNSPGLHAMFRKVLFGEGLADKFTRFATGGMASDRKPFSGDHVPYVLPLIDIVQYAKARGLETIRFHVLGQADFKHDLANVLFAKLVKEEHGIELNVTWDALGFIKHNLNLRTIEVIHEDPFSIDEIWFHRKFLYAPGIAGRRARELLGYHAARAFFGAEHADDGAADLAELIRNCSWITEHLAFLMFLRAHTLATAHCEKEADVLYEHFKAGDETGFSAAATKMLSSLNRNGETRNVKKRAHQILRSLKLLRQLDVFEVKAIINTEYRQYEIPQLLA